MVLVKKKVDFARRSRIDVVASILRASREGAGKTDIMYRCNLSFKPLKDHLNFLTSSGLLREISKSGSSTFEATDKGVAFLQAYNGLKALLGG